MGDLGRAYGGSTSSVLSSCRKYNARLITPPRQCTHKRRISTHSFSFRRAPSPPFNRHCITQDSDLSLNPHTSPPSFPPQPPPQAPLKLPPTHRKQLRPSPNTRCKQPCGMCTSLPVRSLQLVARRLTNRISRPPDIHEGTIVLSVRLGFTGAHNEGEVID